MKKVAVYGIVITLFLMMCDTPVFSGVIDNDEEYSVYETYYANVHELEEDIVQLYLDIHQKKNSQAVYQHILQTIQKTAVLIGEAEPASQDIYEDTRISLQNYMEITLILGLKEQKSRLMDLGCTEEDIALVMDWILQYNDYNHHVTTGFTPEEKNRFYALGVTDEQISVFQTMVNEYYAQSHTAQKVVKQQQTGLMQVQVYLSLAALKLLQEDQGKDNKGKGNNKDKNIDRLQNAEERLLQAILTSSKDQSSLEHIKAYSKQVYKAAEQNIRNGQSEYIVDFFTGLQIHCGAVAALNGDPEFGLNLIKRYKNVVSECAASPERPVVTPVETTESYTQSKPTESYMPEKSVTMKEFVGEIEEEYEHNNMGVVLTIVKAPDTTTWQFFLLIGGVVSGEAFSWIVSNLTISLESLTIGTITVSTLATGFVGAFVLILITIPPVGKGEWPDAVKGSIEGEEIIVIVDGSYGQKHIKKRSQSDEPCIQSSHKAILNDKYMIKTIVEKAQKLFYNKEFGQWIYYYVDARGKEWTVFIRKYGNENFYELRTAYRVDCPPPYECKPTGEEFTTIIGKWLCEGFKLINI
ncbi:MAG: hypothetical protein PVF58_15415 [Candidatus Methanofastidiosia archaeon]|jgi:hypothetical protein